MAVLILLIAAISFFIIADMGKTINQQKEQINKLHLECESYLQTLSKSDIIPATVVENKINQMNKEYGEIKLRIK